MTEEAKWCVEALRDNINNGFLLVGGFNGSVHASEIIHLIESLSAQLEQVEMERDGLNILLAQAQAMLETRTKERDAAVNELVKLEYPIPCESDEFGGSEYCEENCRFKYPQKECWLLYLRELGAEVE